MKNWFTGLMFAASLAAACGTAAAAEVSVDCFAADMTLTQKTVPQDPQRVAVLDYASLDIIDSLNLGDRVVASSKGAVPDYLTPYMENDAIANVGTVKEVSMEHLLRAEPDIIFIGGRLATKMADLERIAPVVMLGVDYEEGLIPSVKRNVDTVKKIFNVQGEDNFVPLEQRLQALQQKAQGLTAVIGLVTASNFNALGNSGRCSLIGHDVGFDNIAHGVKATHGNESSFELLLKLNPDYIFVLDRDSAINVAGAKLAQDLMDNEIVHQTRAWQNGHIVYLTSAAWYLAEGGYHSLDIMLSDIEKAFE